MLLTISYAIAILVFSWALIAFVQSIGAILPWRPSWQASASPARVTVLVPAHNEERCVGRAVQSILSSASPQLQVLVVADNCTDQTEAVALANGAEVLVRTSPQAGGKPQALAYGISQLATNDPPEVLVIVDADCVVGGRGLEHLSRIAIQRGGPVQALNLIDRKPAGDGQALVSILGNRFHNLVRPIGNAKLGLPCLLMGTGMAIPWADMCKVQIDGASLGEDKQLGVDLAIAGAAPSFYPLTKVTSGAPQRYQDYVGQRTRWEQGHVAAAVKAIPRLLYGAVRLRQIGLATLAAELFVPPIAILAACWSAGVLFGTVTWLTTGVYAPLLLTVASAVMLIACVFITWYFFSRRLPLRSLLAAPLHIFRKLPIYVGLLVNGRQQAWLRTEREQ